MLNYFYSLKMNKVYILRENKLKEYILGGNKSDEKKVNNMLFINNYEFLFIICMYKKRK
ncbi:hypothetical protein UT300007_25150 [Clostridium sp. CTA-7]